MDVTTAVVITCLLSFLIGYASGLERGRDKGKEDERNASAIRHERLRRRFSGTYPE